MATTFRNNKLDAEWGTPVPSPLTEALEQYRREGKNIIDLATASLKSHAIRFPQAIIESAMSALPGRLSTYDPEPLGNRNLRRVLADHLQEGGRDATPDRIIVAPGTSMLYFYTFRLLVERGGEVLVPTPGYPLFDDLVTAAGIHARRYHLREGSDGWVLDPEEIAFQVTPRTRAICIVAPHNPLGVSPNAGEWDAIAAIARRHNLAIIVDGVFSGFHPPDKEPAPHPRGDFPLLLQLDGLSKMFFLPGLKISWMTVDGDHTRVTPFLHAMERLADAFLPVSELASTLATGIIPGSRPVLDRFRRDMEELRSIATEELGHITRIPRAGVYLPVKISSTVDATELAMKLLREHGVLVHPGDYYELPGHLVMTLCAGAEKLREGCGIISKLLETLPGRV
ncbi:MAG: pyridoxal phosphate-dependent aminotransferase [Candidatus Sumerlaeia bacterium]|nr:pyridoxal phosphate-dependent aminotransferase [Candidatus Sumerlaeia bacterium]